jgi:thymidine phosphorylase
VLPQEIIAAKRDRRELTPGEIAGFVAGIADGRIADVQVAAFAMAVCLNGMTGPETVALTEAMTRSGTIIDWTHVAAGRPVLDKHSTGGVADTVSLILAPALAACGALVPMISGRGLGHTGGTLDKLDAIPGYRTTPDIETFMRVAGEVGCAIIGQTGELAPADGRLYAIRDVTATVESVPLITASILSKKCAAGLDALVLDVKTGSGAFARSREMAEELAASLARVGKGAGLTTAALITDMNEPLGSAAGNALEVANAIDFLTGRRRDLRLEAVTIALGGAAAVERGGDPALAVPGVAGEAAEGEGETAERFAAMVHALGGPADLVDHPGRHLAPAPLVRAVMPGHAGFVARVDTREVGLAVVELGGGRRAADDRVDHRVGLTGLAAIGDEVGAERPLCIVHAASEAGFEAAAVRIRDAYRLGDAAAPRPPILAHVGGVAS